MTLPWSPSNPGRWSILGLQDPTPSDRPPASIPSLLAWALCPEGSEDPIEGLLVGVQIELRALHEGLAGAHETADPRLTSTLATLGLLARRLEAAIRLLRWTDNRERPPPVSQGEPGGERGPVLPQEPGQEGEG